MVIRLGHLYSVSLKPPHQNPAPFCLESIGRPTSKDFFFCRPTIVLAYYRDRNVSMDSDLDVETDTLLCLMTNGCIDPLF